MNTIWEVKPKPLGIWGWIRSRFLSFATVLGLAFLFMVSTVGSAVVTGLGSRMSGGNAVVAFVLTHLVSLIVMTVLFGLIFKLLPDAKMEWRDVALGAIVTAVLFEIGKVAARVLHQGQREPVFGAAGSAGGCCCGSTTRRRSCSSGRSSRRRTPSVTAAASSPRSTRSRSPARTAPSRAWSATSDSRPRRRRPKAVRCAPAAAPRAQALAPAAGGDSGDSRLRRVVGTLGRQRTGRLEPVRARRCRRLGGRPGRRPGGDGAAKDEKRPAKKHIAAVKLDERMRSVEGRIGKLSRIQQYLENETVYQRIQQVEKKIRHARTAIRARGDRPAAAGSSAWATSWRETKLNASRDTGVPPVLMVPSMRDARVTL